MSTEVTSSKKRRFRWFGGGKANKSVVPKKKTAQKSKSTAKQVQPPLEVRVDTPKSRSSRKKTTTSSSTTPTSTSSSWLSRSKYFQQMSNAAFDMVDADQSGSVDEKELYSGLLLIHLKLGCYAGPAACRPVDRDKVHTVFLKMDVDKSGSLDRKEFQQVMMVLCSNVLTRVMAQYALTLLIVPLLAQKLLDGVYWLIEHFYNIVVNLDEYSPLMDKLEVFIETTRDRLLDATPRVILSAGSTIGGLLEKVPEAVWNTIPLTLLTCILGILVVPYVIFKIDDFFQQMADKKKDEISKE